MEFLTEIQKVWNAFKSEISDTYVSIFFVCFVVSFLLFYLFTALKVYKKDRELLLEAAIKHKLNVKFSYSFKQVVFKIDHRDKRKCRCSRRRMKKINTNNNKKKGSF